MSYEVIRIGQSWWHLSSQSCLFTPRFTQQTIPLQFLETARYFRQKEVHVSNHKYTLSFYKEELNKAVKMLSILGLDFEQQRGLSGDNVFKGG